MAEVEFNDFLSQLGKDTVSRIKKEQPKIEQPKVEETVKPIHQSVQPVIEPQIVQTSVQSLDEEFFANALDYANIVLKSVRDSFESQEEKRKVCESIRNAMNFYLGESTSVPQAVKPEVVQTKMSEKDWDKVPVIQQPEKIQESSESVGYETDTNMSLKSDNSVDLSHITTDDISEFKVLAGIK